MAEVIVEIISEIAGELLDFLVNDALKRRKSEKKHKKHKNETI